MEQERKSCIEQVKEQAYTVSDTMCYTTSAVTQALGNYHLLPVTSLHIHSCCIVSHKR